MSYLFSSSFQFNIKINCRFLKSKVAILQTELEMSKKANDSLEKENSKNAKKISKFQSQIDKSNSKIISLESALKNLQDEHVATKEDLKVQQNQLNLCANYYNILF